MVSRRPGVIVRDVAVDGRQISLHLDADDRRWFRGADRGGSRRTSRSRRVSDADGIRLVGVLPPGRVVIDRETGVRHPPAWTAFVESGRGSARPSRCSTTQPATGPTRSAACWCVATPARASRSSTFRTSSRSTMSSASTTKTPVPASHRHGSWAIPRHSHW